jgi:hypothetical protein
VVILIVEWLRLMLIMLMLFISQRLRQMRDRISLG